MVKVSLINFMLLLAFMFTWPKQLISQKNEIRGKYFVKDGTVFIRWAVSDLSVFKSISKKGYQVYRAEQKDGNKEYKLMAEIKPLPKDDKSWKQHIQKNKAFGFLFSTLYKPNVANAKDENIYYHLSLLACDQDTTAAKLMGLWFTDAPGEGNFTYIIKPSDHLLSSIKSLTLSVNSHENSLLPVPDSLIAKASGKEIKLLWPHAKNKAHYTGYSIERSLDGKTYEKRNKELQVQIQTKVEKTKNEIVFNDTTFSYNTVYHYRVIGLNHFGHFSEPSKAITIRVPQPIRSIVSIDSYSITSQNKLDLFWHLTGKDTPEDIKGYKVMRSMYDAGPYTFVTKTHITDLRYSDSVSAKRCFYKLVVYNKYGDSSISHPIMCMIPDMTPPAKPYIIKGVIDSSGVVKLHWKKNNEHDLMGYRVFRCNALNEEQVEITKKLLKDTLFTDKTDLHTLTEKVYYFVTAVDSVYNNSPYSDPYELTRPDKIPPVPAVITNVESSDHGITIRWIKSTSKDANTYTLYRNSQTTAALKLKKWNHSDSTVAFIDSTNLAEGYYSYQLITTDKTNNSSDHTSKSVYTHAHLRKRIDFTSHKIDFEKKLIQLKWASAINDVFSYTLYRSKNNGPYLSYKTFKGNTTEFTDSDLNIGNTYSYRIKALFTNGLESKPSKELKLEY